MELNDPWLSDLVRRVETDENIIDTFESLRTPDADEDDSTVRKIEALAEIICRAGDEPSAALFTLMETVESSGHSNIFTSRAKHVAFSRCGELHVYKKIDAQIAEVESHLLAGNTLVSS